MALHYDVHCSACGCTESLISDYTDFVQDDGTRVCLPHPAEEQTLQELGHEWRDTASQGRIVQSNAYFCLKCLRMVDLESPARPDRFLFSKSKSRRWETFWSVFGVLAGIAAAIAWRGWDVWLVPPGIAGGLIALLTYNIAQWHRGRCRFTQLVGPIQRSCPHCHGNELADFTHPLQHPELLWHCPKCGQLACKAIPGAISMS
jgi:hypothetical protein